MLNTYQQRFTDICIHTYIDVSTPQQGSEGPTFTPATGNSEELEQQRNNKKQKNKRTNDLRSTAKYRNGRYEQEYDSITSPEITTGLNSPSRDPPGQQQKRSCSSSEQGETESIPPAPHSKQSSSSLHQKHPVQLLPQHCSSRGPKVQRMVAADRKKLDC